MRAWQVYHDGNLVQLQWTTSSSESVPVNRICSIKDNFLMLLTYDGCLYDCHLEINTNTLKFQLQREKVYDVDYCARLQKLFVVTDEGIVLTRTVNGGGCAMSSGAAVAFDEWETMSFDPLEISEDGIRIRRVCCSGFGAVFITYSHDIYVIGSCGDIFSVDASQPKHMRFFDEASIDGVIDIVAGDEFFALLLRASYDEKLNILDLNNKPGHKAANALATTPSTSSKRRIQSAPLTPSSQCGSIVTQPQSHFTRQLTPETEANNVLFHQDLNSNSSLHSYSGSSTKSSQASHDFEVQDVTHQLLRHGYALLHTQVHTFGSANNGLLGTGDHIKRGAINHIKKLDAIGVCNIAAGQEHTVIRTLDGRLLHWGLNSKQQLQPKLDEQKDLSSPTECEISGGGDHQRSVLATCCGDFRTVLLNTRGELYVKNNKLTEQLSDIDQVSSNDEDFLALQFGDASSKREYPLVLAAGNFTVHNQRKFRQVFHNSLVALQTQLKQLLQSAHVINMLQMFQQERNGRISSLQQLQIVCLNYRKILCLVAAAVKSLEAFYRGDFESPADLLFIKHHREFITVFEAYTRTNCDVYSIDGYTEASKYLTKLPTPLIASSSGSGNNQIAAEQIDLSRVFQQPLNVVSAILQLLEQLSKTQREYAEHLLAWQAYARQNTINVELAENTLDFWHRNERNLKIRHFRRRHRRVILTSSSVPLKLSQHGISISSPTFILFSDCLCQLSSQLCTFSLMVMWIKIESDTSLRITTPEKSFVVTALNHHDKMLWYDQLESSILAALGRPQGTKLASVRTAAYVFSNSNSKYAGVHAYGRWRNGLLHGTCYLEYPDGRFYFGEMRNGEIEGYGKMVIPSVGLYEGTFKAGKFHGNGTYEMKDEVYEGNFREGLFHGHGLLRNNNYTYVGEYQANAKCGYGVLDDMITGDKYMGMFADNKRIGAGTCITMTGDYFEGIFASDELAGTGIAVFENDYYYEGELSMTGPCGKGVYYMPNGVAESEDPGINGTDDMSNRMLVGNILSGQLIGNWQNVRVISGNVAINQHFSKYPKSIGELVVDNKRKWRSLFENFEEQVFCTSNNATSSRISTENASLTAASTARMYWNRIAVFMTTQREREKALEQDTLSAESRHSYFARNISMGFACRSFDRLNLKSANSLCSEGTFHDLKSTTNRLNKLDASPLRSQSQETLYDSILALNEFNSLQQPSEDIRSFSGQLANWANDTMNGYGVNNGSDYIQSSIGTSASSLRSSYDSVFNLNTSFNNNNSFSSMVCPQNALEYVPSFGITSLNESDIVAIKEYLSQAFKDRHHPFYLLNQRIANCFYISYGCWKVKPSPIIAKQAMNEWECMSRQIYCFVRKLFPALPEEFCVIESTREVISHITLLYPIVLTEGIYSTLFVLYANKYSRKDELYRQNLIFAEKLHDDELALQLCLESTLLAVVGTSLFADAIQSLKQLQEKHSPKAMLGVIERCMQLITDAHKMVENANTVIMAADSIMPLTLFLVLRAAVPHLGAELGLLDDLTGGPNFQFEMNGIAGYCYTTLKAAYEHITAKPLHNKST